MNKNESNQYSQQSSKSHNQLSAEKEVNNQIISNISQSAPAENTNKNSVDSVISKTKKNDTLALTNYL